MAYTSSTSHTQPASGKVGLGFAIASLILGIFGTLFGWVFVGLIPGILAIIFGIIALKKHVGKGMAITGIITGAVGVISALTVIALALQYAPAINQSQKPGAGDTQRKTDVSTIASYVSSYQSQNNGKLPQADIIARTYATDNVRIVSSGTPTKSMAVYSVGQNCDGASGLQEFALRIKLDDGTIYCKGS